MDENENKNFGGYNSGDYSTDSTSEPVNQDYQTNNQPYPDPNSYYTNQTYTTDQTYNSNENSFNQDNYQYTVEPGPGQSNQGAGFSIAGMVLGIISLLCCGYIGAICAIVGLILSGLALKNQAAGRGMAIAGLVCSIVGLATAIIYLVIYSTAALGTIPFLNQIRNYR